MNLLLCGHSFENTCRANILLFEVSLCFSFLFSITLKDLLFLHSNSLLSCFFFPYLFSTIRFVCLLRWTLSSLSFTLFTLAFHGHISSFLMAGVVPKALIFCHSLVKRLDCDLRMGFDVCAA